MSDRLIIYSHWRGDRCRLISILGMGGIGKTAVAAKLAQQVQFEFEYVIWRSLIEKISMQYTQQPVVMEYVTERFIDLCCPEILKEKTIFLKSHTLIKVTDQDYVRESQIRVILKPLVTQIDAILGFR